LTPLRVNLVCLFGAAIASVSAFATWTIDAEWLLHEGWTTSAESWSLVDLLRGGDLWWIFPLPFIIGTAAAYFSPLAGFLQLASIVLYSPLTFGPMVPTGGSGNHTYLPGVGFYAGLVATALVLASLFFPRGIGYTGTPPGTDFPGRLLTVSVLPLAQGAGPSGPPPSGSGLLKRMRGGWRVPNLRLILLVLAVLAVVTLPPVFAYTQPWSDLRVSVLTYDRCDAVRLAIYLDGELVGLREVGPQLPECPDWPTVFDEVYAVRPGAHSVGLDYSGDPGVSPDGAVDYTRFVDMGPLSKWEIVFTFGFGFG